MKPNRSSLFSLLSLLAITVASADKPNILVILVDDMGYGDAGCFNPDSKIATPYIDKLAAEGMMFRDAHAPGPLCHMSRYGLLTGRYPFRTDVTVWPTKPLIKEGQMTIASLLKSQGYYTAMVGKWHLGFEETGYENPLPGGPVDRGFDSYFGIRASTDIPPYFYIRGDKAVQPPSNYIEAVASEGWTPIQGEFSRAGGISPDLTLEGVLPRFSDEAIEVIEGHSRDRARADKPLMLYLAYPAPHTPWLPSEEFVGKSEASMYGDFMMMVDDEIGRVLKALENEGMKEDTLVIFTSDNGPVWYDQDVERLGHDSAGGLRGMKSDAWEGGHRMPFIARWPGSVEAGTSTDQLVCFTDLMATFADIVEVQLPPNAGPDSFSFLPALTGAKSYNTPVRKSVVMKSGSGGLMTIRSGDWKFIDGRGSGGFSDRGVRGGDPLADGGGTPQSKPKPQGPSGQLYNMKDDIGETRNLYAERPEIVESLKKEMAKIMRSSKSR